MRIAGVANPIAVAIRLRHVGGLRAHIARVVDAIEILVVPDRDAGRCIGLGLPEADPPARGEQQDEEPRGHVVES